MVGTPLVPTRPGRHGAQRRARTAPLGAGTGATPGPPGGTSSASRRENWVPSYPQINASRARVYARGFLDSWIQGFGFFKPLI